LGEVLYRDIQQGQKTDNDEDSREQSEDEVEGHGGGRVGALMLVGCANGLPQYAVPP